MKKIALVSGINLSMYDGDKIALVTSKITLKQAKFLTRHAICCLAYKIQCETLSTLLGRNLISSSKIAAFVAGDIGIIAHTEKGVAVFYKVCFIEKRNLRLLKSKKCANLKKLTDESLKPGLPTYLF